VVVTEIGRQLLRGRTVDTTGWYNFKREVARRHGSERGHLDAELDIALKEYVDKRIDNRFRTIQ
jgi:hypothetical protein